MTQGLEFPALPESEIEGFAISTEMDKHCGRLLCCADWLFGG